MLGLSSAVRSRRDYSKEYSMRSKSLLILALAAALVGAPASTRAAPDQTLGVALMSAVVNQLGTLLRGAGAVSATRNSTGNYRVIFNRQVLGKCTYVAMAEVGPMSGGAFARVDETVSNVNSVIVLTRNANNDEEDRAFELIAFCTQ
jgi:hypothetical protein